MQQGATKCIDSELVDTEGCLSDRQPAAADNGVTSRLTCIFIFCKFSPPWPQNPSRLPAFHMTRPVSPANTRYMYGNAGQTLSYAYVLV